MKQVSLLTLLFYFVLIVNAQTDEGSSGSGLRNLPVDNTAEIKFNQISSDAGRYFKEALLHFRDGERSIAREKFDRAVEVFIMSGINVRASKNLNDCYNQLIETVYRIEFPSSQQPQIRSLSATCGWNIDNKLADDVVAKLAQPAPQQQQNNATTDKNLVTAVADNKTQSTVPQAGFTDQGFEVSPLDDLAKLELNSDAKRKPQRGANACQELNSPIVQGLRLEISLAQIKRNPMLDFRKAKISTAIKNTFYFNNINSNVNTLTLTFYQNQLQAMMVFYSDNIKWRSLEEFRSKVSTSLGVDGIWKKNQGVFDESQEIACRNFTLKLIKKGNEYSIFISSNNLMKKMIEDQIKEQERERSINEKKKESFKP
ncbi:MAG: hypothetical protein M3384_06225 [Acidobacteriota bacterium]|nr:hypothetical protein [Acidobacteriota bacterium]